MNSPDSPLSHASAWFTIWGRPRATMQHILTEKRWGLGLLWAIILGLLQGIFLTLSQGPDDQPFLLAMVLNAVAYTILSVIVYFLVAFFMRWTGSWLGGQANYTGMLQAIGWSYTILIWGYVLKVIETFVLGTPLFIDFPSFEVLQLFQWGVLSQDLLWSLFVFLETVLQIWWFIVCLKCIGAAHQFSAWRALGAYIFTAVILTLITWVVMRTFSMLFGPMSYSTSFAPTLNLFQSLAGR